MRKFQIQPNNQTKQEQTQIFQSRNAISTQLGSFIQTQKKIIVDENNDISINIDEKKTKSILNFKQNQQKSLSNLENDFIINEIYESYNEIPQEIQLHLQRIESEFNLSVVKKKFKLLILSIEQNELNSQNYFALLLDLWSDSNISKEDKVRILGKFNIETNSIILQNLANQINQDQFLLNYNYMIIEPEQIIYPTILTKAISCQRRAFISKYIEGKEIPSNIILKGKLLHDIFEYLMNLASENQDKNFILTENTIKSQYNNFISQYIEELWLLQLSEQDVYNQIKEQFLPMINWIQKHVINKTELTKLINRTGREYHLQIMNVIEVESEIVSKEIGMKGYIDILLRCKVFDNQNKEERIIILPFELKTGANKYTLYDAQVLIYCLLISFQYKSEQNSQNCMGLLYYLQQNEIEWKFPNYQIISQLLIKRNNLAKNLKSFHDLNNQKQIVEKINNKSECEKCFFRIECNVLQYFEQQQKLNSLKQKQLTLNQSQKKYEKFLELEEIQGNNEVNDIQDEKILEIIEKIELDCSQQIPISHFLYLYKWYSLLQQEEYYENKESYYLKNKITKFSFAKKMDIIQNSSNNFYLENVDDFISQIQLLFSTKNNSFLKKQVKNYLYFNYIISSQNRDECISFYDYFYQNDFISVKQHDYDLNFKCNIINKYFSKKVVNSVKTYFCLVKIKFSSNELINQESKLINFVNKNQQNFNWQLSKIQKNHFTLMRMNIIELCISSDPYIKQFQKILIQNEKLEQEEDKQFSQKEIDELNVKYKNLNADQQNALKACLTSPIFHLILGMPGTGKSFLISILLNVLIQKNFKVLICAYTNTALDNIINTYSNLFSDLKYKEQIVRFTKNSSQINENLKNFCYNNVVAKENLGINTTTELKKYFDSKLLYFSTLLAINNQILNQTVYDYCIIDEASQAIEPIIIGSILKSKKFILIGDHFQLQPLIKTPDEGTLLKISLFERLCNQYPEHRSDLTIQYRMNQQIMDISNKLIYGNKLKCGNREVQNSMLIFINDNQFRNNWEWKLLDPEQRIIVVNMDCIQDFHNQIQIPSSDKKDNQFLEEISNQFTKCQQHQDYQNSSSSCIFNNSNSNSLINNYEQFNDIGEKWMAKAEIQIGLFCIKKLKKLGIQEKEIGVMAIYNKQRLIMEKKLLNSQIQVLTVDKCQGLDKDVFIILCSRRVAKHDLLNDWRRINVAFTRAKKKIIVIGSVNYMKDSDKLNYFIQLAVENMQIHNLNKQQLEDAINFNNSTIF